MVILSRRDLTIAIWEEYKKKHPYLPDFNALFTFEQQYIEELATCALRWMPMKIPDIYAGEDGKEFILGANGKRIYKLSEAFRKAIS